MNDEPKSKRGGARAGAGRKPWKDPADCKTKVSFALAPDCIAYLATQPVKVAAVEAALRAQRDSGTARKSESQNG